MKNLTYWVVFFTMLLSACSDDDDCGCTGDIYGKWEAKAFMSVESRGYPKDDDFNPTIEFKSDRTADVQLDVNACFGDFELQGENVIQISEMGCTEACCDSDFSQKFIEMLPQVNSYEIEDNTLKLHVSMWGWIELNRTSD